MEIMIVVVLLAILGMLALPSSGYQNNEKVRQAARLLLEDLALAQVTAIGRGLEDGCAVVIEPHGYKLELPGATWTHFGHGRAHSLRDVSLSTPTHLQFNALGTLTPANDATITLRCGDAQLRIHVDAQTGNARID